MLNESRSGKGEHPLEKPEGLTGEIRIAVSGRSGCGNTTVSRLLSEILGVRMINYTFHTLAEEKGMDFYEFCRMAEEDPRWDRLVDQRQVEMAREESCVPGSRLAIWMLEEADLKVFLTASPEERARRIQKRDGGDLQAVMEKTARRDEKDHQRYQKLYGIDNNDYGFADLVINTDRLSPEQVARAVLGAVDWPGETLYNEGQKQ